MRHVTVWSSTNVSCVVLTCGYISHVPYASVFFWLPSADVLELPSSGGTGFFSSDAFSHLQTAGTINTSQCSQFLMRTRSQVMFT